MPDVRGLVAGHHGLGEAGYGVEAEPPGRGGEAAGDLFDAACPTRELLDRVADKWTSVLVTLLAGLRTRCRRAHYRLTPPGRSLDEPLAAPRGWAERHVAGIDGHRTGRSPGTRIPEPAEPRRIDNGNALP